MTKFSLSILNILKNTGAAAFKSISISQVIELLPANQRKSYSTTYRHMLLLKGLGYVIQGLDDGPAGTYYISDAGEQFCMKQGAY